MTTSPLDVIIVIMSSLLGYPLLLGYSYCQGIPVAGVFLLRGYILYWVTQSKSLCLTQHTHHFVQVFCHACVVRSYIVRSLGYPVLNMLLICEPPCSSVHLQTRHSLQNEATVLLGWHLSYAKVDIKSHESLSSIYDLKSFNHLPCHISFSHTFAM